MSFKENLRDEMEFQDVKTKELSEKTGLSVNTIRNYINGHNALPNVEAAVKIAQALDVSVEYLVTGGTEKTPQIPAETRFVAETFNTLSENDKKSVIALLKEMKSHRKKYLQIFLRKIFPLCLE